MSDLLDPAGPNGAMNATITFRPERLALPVELGLSNFEEAVEFNCQVWSGATHPIVPTSDTGKIDGQYVEVLPGALVDRIHGIRSDQFEVLDEISVDWSDRSFFGMQAALSLYDYKSDEPASISCPELDADDPWRGIYLACLGSLPKDPSPELLKENFLIPELKFRDFLKLDRPRVVGSLSDLIERCLTFGKISPRQFSMSGLPYGTNGSSRIRSGHKLLPGDSPAYVDAGPNVVVICTEGDTRDLALLWNLRGACGDWRPAPIGLPVQFATKDNLAKIYHAPWLARNGLSAAPLYVTSFSLSPSQIGEAIGNSEDLRPAIVPPSELLDFGFGAGWRRQEVLHFDDGDLMFVPASMESHADIFKKHPISEYARMVADIYLEESPLPANRSHRYRAANFGIYHGALHVEVGTRSRGEAFNLHWPGNLILARSFTRSRRLDLRESRPGVAARQSLTGIEGLGWVSNLIHAPLLNLLEHMSARQGFNWYKERLGSGGGTAHPLDSVAPDLQTGTSKRFSDFKKVFNNNDKATKHWLFWAERSHLILKGFEVNCETCGASQWVSVGAFSPGSLCQACSMPISFPFSDRTSVNFSYRLAEPMRRLYENDAMGHLLTARYISSLLGTTRRGGLVGVHPGLEVLQLEHKAPRGEADVIVFTNRGELVPIEVKRSVSGLTEEELGKLDSLCGILSSPWCAVVACEYASSASTDITQFRQYWPDGTYRRVALTYDSILDPHAVRALGGDCFNVSPLTGQDIANREKGFVRSLCDQADHSSMNWSDEILLRPPSAEECLG